MVVGQAERRRARRRPAAGGRSSRSIAGQVPPPRCRTSTGTSMSRRQRLHSSARAVVQVGRRRGCRGSCARAGPGPSIGLGQRAGRRRGRSSTPATVVGRGRRRASRRAGPPTFQASGPSSERPAVTAVCWTAPAASSSQRLGLAAGRRRRPSSSATRSAARRSSSRAMPFLMLWSVLTTSPSRPTSTPTRVLVRAAPDLVGVACASPMIRRLSASAAGSGRARR